MNKVTAILIDENLRLKNTAIKLGFLNFVAIDKKVFKNNELASCDLYAHYKHFESFEATLNFYKTLKESIPEIDFGMNFDGIVYIQYKFYQIFFYNGNRRQKILNLYGIEDFSPVKSSAL